MRLLVDTRCNFANECFTRPKTRPNYEIIIVDPTSSFYESLN